MPDAAAAAAALLPTCAASSPIGSFQECGRRRRRPHRQKHPPRLASFPGPHPAWNRMLRSFGSHSSLLWYKGRRAGRETVNRTQTAFVTQSLCRSLGPKLRLSLFAPWPWSLRARWAFVMLCDFQQSAERTNEPPLRKGRRTNEEGSEGREKQKAVSENSFVAPCYDQSRAEQSRARDSRPSWVERIARGRAGTKNIAGSAKTRNKRSCAKFTHFGFE